MNTNETPLPVALGSTEGLGVISREEWVRRYAARVRQRAGWTPEESAECARVGAEEYERNERAAGNAVAWIGGPVGRLETPEEQADEEMSYWTDDGEG